MSEQGRCSGPVGAQLSTAPAQTGAKLSRGRAQLTLATRPAHHFLHRSQILDPPPDRPLWRPLGRPSRLPCVRPRTQRFVLRAAQRNSRDYALTRWLSKRPRRASLKKMASQAPMTTLPALLVVVQTRLFYRCFGKRLPYKAGKRMGGFRIWCRCRRADRGYWQKARKGLVVGLQLQIPDKM